MIKQQIAIEYVKELDKKRQEINNIKFEQIEWTENGKVIAIPKKIIDEFNFCGLSNIDFITIGIYKIKENFV